MKTSHTLAEQDTATSTQANTLTGHGSMAGNSISESSREALENAQSDSPGMQTMLAYLGQDAAGETLAGDALAAQTMAPGEGNAITPGELVKKLDAFKVFYDHLTGTYKGPVNEINYSYFYSETPPLAEKFKTVFTDANLTDDDATQLLAIDSKKLSKQGIALKKFFTDNGVAIITTTRTRAEAIIKTHEDLRYLKDLNDAIDKQQEYYRENIQSKSRYIITQADVDHTVALEKNLDDYIAFYDKADVPIQEDQKTAYDNHKADKKRVTENIKTLRLSLLKADQLRNERKKMDSMSPADKITYNPAVRPADTNTVSYNKKNTADPNSKNYEKQKEKIDNPNKKFLASENIYTKKDDNVPGSTDSYNIYKSGTGDKDEVSENDIKQGSLGDCYLLSAMGAIARANPAMVKKLINYTPGNTYATVTLYMRDEKTQELKPETIDVDFYFPVKNSDQAYANSGDGEMWVMLIEKAFAKLMGGYEAIEAGTGAEAFALLTGKEAETKHIDDASLKKTANDATIPTMDTLQNILSDSVSAGKTATASSKSAKDYKGPGTTNQRDPADPSFGHEIHFDPANKKALIVCEHAYMIMQVDTLKKTVTLRNPHGDSYDASSTLIPAEVTLTFQQFQDCFDSIAVCNV